MEVITAKSAGFRSLRALANSHCIWLIYRKEGKVYIAKCGHLFYWLGISCHIYPESPEIKDISIATPLRVQHLPACGGVICRDNRIADTSCNLPGISIGQNASSAKGGNRFGIAIEQGLLR